MGCISGDLRERMSSSSMRRGGMGDSLMSDPKRARSAWTSWSIFMKGGRTDGSRCQHECKISESCVDHRRCRGGSGRMSSPG